MSLQPCDKENYNFGVPNCTEVMGSPFKIIGVKQKDSTGADNKIAAGTTIDQAFLDTRTKDLDLTTRWFITPEVKNFLSAKEDTEYVTYDDKSRDELSEGLRTFTGLFVGANGRYIKFLKSLGFSHFFVITNLNVLIGYEKDDTGDIYPIKIDIFAPKLIFKNGSELQGASFVLDIPLSVKDENIMGFHGSTAELTEAEGLVQLDMELTVPTATGFTLTIGVAGQFGNSSPFLDLATTDLIAFDVTADAPLVVASVTYVSDGVYIVAFTAAVSGNTVRVSESQALIDGGVSFNKRTNTLA